MGKRPFSATLFLLLLCLLLLSTGDRAMAAITLPLAWFYESEQSSADLGYAVNGAGDVNGDGYPDVVVGAVKYGQGSVKGGAVFLFYGGPGGLSSQPDWFFGTDMNGAELGTAVSGVGDVNGDGYDDLAVSAPRCSNPEPKEGCVFIFFGSPTGLPSTPDQILELNQRDAYLGTAVDAAGDVNGDGYADVIVGAKWYTNELINEGAAFLFLGGPDGLRGTPAWQVEGNQAAASLGTAVAGVGDVDGDGYADLLVGAPYFDGGAVDTGYVALYFGGAEGPVAAPAWERHGSHAGARLGYSLAAAGDVNGDGLADLIIGAPGWQNQSGEAVGAAFVYLGRPDWSDALPVWTAVFTQANAQFGAAVGSAGDMSGNGFADVVVGAPLYSRDQAKEGAMFVFLGTAVGPASTAHWMAEGNKADTLFGFSVASAGDVNQDGYTDLLVGAPEYRNQTELRGRAFLFNGQDADTPLATLYLPLISHN